MRTPARMTLKAVLAGMAFLAAGWSLGAHAQTEITLVKNSGQTQADLQFGSTAATLIVPQAAQVFTTGNFSKGYRVTKVLVGSSGTTAYVLNLYTANNQGRPATNLGLFNQPTTFSTGMNTFTRSGSHIILKPNTDYVVVLEVDDEDTVVTLKGTRSDTEETKVDSWSIANNALVRDPNNPPYAWYGYDRREEALGTLDGAAWASFRMEIKGHRHNNRPTSANATVSTNEDEAYTFKVADFSFSDADTVDSLSKVKIQTLPADGTLALDGSAIASGDLPKDVAVADITAGKLTYTPPADGNGDPFTSFTFKVNDGTDDSTNAYTMTIDVAPVPDTATGEVRIVTPHIVAVPATLSVDFSGIVEPDGKDGIESTARYAWHRYEAVSGRLFDANIGTGATYTLTREDVTHFKIGVTVTFTDDEGGAEGPFESARVPSGTGTIGTDPVCSPPVLLGGAKLLGGARKTAVGKESVAMVYGYRESDGLGSMDSKSFTTTSGNSYEIDEWTARVGTHLTFSLKAALTATDREKLEVHDCAEGYKLGDSHTAHSGFSYIWVTTHPDWTGSASRTLYVSEDTEPPELLYARTRDDKVRLYFSEALAAADSLANSAFAVKRTPTGGSAQTLSLSGTPQIEANVVTLTLASEMASTPAGVTVSYTKPTNVSSNAITDGFGNDAASFTDQYVINYNMRSSNAVRVVGMTFSGPGADNLYASGETLDVTVEFSQAVTLSLVGKNSNGRQIEERYRRMGLQTAGPVLGMGRECRSAHENVHGHTGGAHAVYHSGNGTTHVTFRCTIAEGGPWLRANVPANAFFYRYGNIKRTSDQRHAINTDHPPYFRQDMTETARPRITSGPIVSGPGADGVWKEGDAGEGKTVEVAYTFSAPVRIVETAPRGKPSVHLFVGFTKRNAELVRTSGNTLVFAAGGGGTGARRVLVPANALKLNTYVFDSPYDPFLETALILDAQTGMPAALGHAEVEATSSGQSHTDPPTVSGTPAVSAAGSDSQWTEGETVEVTVTFSEAVVVDTTGGTPTIGIALGGTEAKSAGYVRGTGTTELVFSYTLVPGDGSHAAMGVTADSLALNGGTILSQSSAFAALLGHNGAAVSGGSGPRSEPSGPTARFDNAPDDHNGTDPVTFELHFSQAPEGLGYRTVGGALLEVTGGTVTGARRLAWNDNSAWEVSVQPSGNADLVIRLPSRACEEANAVCVGGVPLAAEVSVTVPREGQEQTEPLPPFTGAFAGRVPTEHDGSTKMEFEFHLSHNPGHLSYETVRDDLFTVTGGSIESAWRRTQGAERHMHWNLRVAPAGEGDVTIALKPTTDCAGTPGVCRLSDGAMLASYLRQTIKGPATLSVADATVREAAGATLDFVVTLSRTRFATTTVQYATSDGTATAGSDYTETRGTLTFTALQTSKTISVPVLDDGHDEGNETLTLTLSNPSGAKLGDATATGTIENDDPMPQAWITRFGRTVGSQVVEAVSGRVAESPGEHVTVGGMNLMGTGALAEEEPVSQLRLPDWDERSKLDATTRSMTMDEIVLGSSFHLSAGERVPGHAAFSAWGRFVTGGFEATEDKVTLDGDVTTGMLGADAEWDGFLAGVLVTQSSGDGSYRLNESEGDDKGTVESTMTGVYPYARVNLNARVSAWGVVGTGSGDLTLRRKGEEGTGTQIMDTDLGMRMGAIGVRGQAPRGRRAPSGVGLNLKSDAMWVSTETDKTQGMEGAEGEVSRLRLIVQGERAFAMERGGSLVPRAELGVRVDGGDAETGAGLEAGAGIRYTRGSFVIEGQVRGLVAHEESGYEEWGASAAMRVSPSAPGRGLTASLTPVWGNAGSQAARLWGARDARGLGAGGEFEPSARMDAELGYGFAVAHTPGIVTPYTAMSLREGSGRHIRAGTRWNLAPGAVLGLEATREEGTDDAGPRHAIRFRTEVRW